DWREALQSALSARDIYRTLNDAVGLAHAVGFVASLRDILGDKDGARAAFRQLKTALEGTACYDLMAQTDIQLAELEAESDNLQEALELANAAVSLCRKYQLPILGAALVCADRLASAMRARRPPELDTGGLIDELY